MSNQPSYHCIANLGDANPFVYGGSFVLVDKRGVYDPQIWHWEPDEGDEAEPKGGTLYQFDIPKCIRCKDEPGNGVSENHYHPNKPEWYSKEAADVESFCGFRDGELESDMISSDVLARAWAYMAIGGYHGFENLDHNPLRDPDMKWIKRLCGHFLKQIKQTNKWKDGIGL